MENGYMHSMIVAEEVGLFDIYLDETETETIQGQKMDGFDEEAFKKFFPSGFGKQDRGPDVATQIDRTKRTVVRKEDDEVSTAQIASKAEDDRSRKQASSPASDSGSDSDEDSDDDDDEDEFPTSHDLTFKTHEKAVTTVTVDHAGARMITGSADCTIKLHDFSSMTPSTLRAFKSVEPSARKQATASEVHPVRTVEFNPISPSQVLVLSATTQGKILDRDGDTLTAFVKGDMYLRDMRHTKGHISEITSGRWSPTDYNLCVTAATDSTVRIWDVNHGRSQKDVIVHKSRAPGSAGRSRMTAVAWGSAAQGGSEVIVAAALDGTLSMWSTKGQFTRPSAEVPLAHDRDTWVSDIDVSPDGRLIVTRASDSTVKLWDTRKLKQPVNTATFATGLKHASDYKIRFSPNGANVLTGSETGDLHILNPATLRPELTTPVTPGSPLITAMWHEKLNQIITGSSNGETHLLYNPEKSINGAVLIMSKAPKRRHIDDNPALTTDLSQGIPLDAGSQSLAARHRPGVGLTASGRSRDPRRPHLPAQTPFSKFQPDERHIKESIPLSSMRDEDPREALLKYADAAEKDPVFTKIWSKTQPKPVFAELSDEEDEGSQGPERKKLKK
ncbi:WD domain-containing protein [Ascosphaera apis ARSEF 7405]|uniref:WD domain-containing protein n=1 Tax=Ascosphaera apis ARSEF 7405 TaxID=392613 RepID=A0A162IT69_9EURO|nr:WD domain-containing protein [Ascosphaera apis ARSEF 7405]